MITERSYVMPFIYRSLFHDKNKTQFGLIQFRLIAFFENP